MGKDRDIEPQLVLVEDRNPLLDDPVLFQALETPPEGCVRQAHFLRHIGDGQGRVILDHCQNLAIHLVHVIVSSICVK